MSRFSLYYDVPSQLWSSPATGRLAGSQYGYDSSFAYQNAENDEQRQLAIISLQREICEAEAFQRNKSKSSNKRSKAQDNEEELFPSPPTPVQEQGPLEIPHVLAMRQWSAERGEDTESWVAEWVEDQSAKSEQEGDAGELKSLDTLLPKDVPPIDSKHLMLAQGCGSRFVEHL